MTVLSVGLLLKEKFTSCKEVGGAAKILHSSEGSQYGWHKEPIHRIALTTTREGADTVLGVGRRAILVTRPVDTNAKPPAKVCSSINNKMWCFNQNAIILY